MYICFIDESGCPGTLPDENSDIQPALVIAGLIINSNNIAELTRNFLSLKKEFFPKKLMAFQHLDCIKVEIKGADLRKMIKKNRTQRRFALRFINNILDLLKENDVSIIGRVWIKSIGKQFDGKAVYTSSIQYITSCFQHYLINTNHHGVIIADSRQKHLNSNVSHSIFTQKYKMTGDVYNRLIEMPVYGHSDNHAVLQLADVIASALLFPIATSVYCSGYIKNTMHHSPNYLVLREKFGEKLANLQYRSLGLDKKKPTIKGGGIVLSDPLGERSGSGLFKPFNPQTPAKRIIA